MGAAGFLKAARARGILGGNPPRRRVPRARGAGHPRRGHGEAHEGGDRALPGPRRGKGGGTMSATVFEKSEAGAPRLPHSRERLPAPGRSTSPGLRTAPLGLPEMGEQDIVRHYVELASKNYHVDKGIYPLGSCTMKYNPLVNEEVARLEGFTGLHPAQDEADAQGALELMWRLERALCRDNRDGGLHAPARRGRPRGAHGNHDRARVFRRPRREAEGRAHSRLRPRDESGERGHLRLHAEDDRRRTSAASSIRRCSRER